MAAQQHKIMRQVVEVRGCREDGAERIAAAVRRACDEHLLPLIESICSDASGASRIDRIETLEIDLGAVPREGFEAALGERFETAFRRELAIAIENAPPVDSDLELFACFIRTGALPWWAETSDGSLLETSLLALLQRAPGAVRAQMLSVDDPDRMRRRIARAYSDRALDALVHAAANAADHSGAGRAGWVPLLEAAAGAWGCPARTARHLWWEEVLRAVCAGGWSAGAAGMRPVLVRLARALGLDYARVVADLWGAAQAADTRQPTSAYRVAQALWHELHPPAVEPRRAPSAAELPAALVELLARLCEMPGAHSVFWSTLCSAAARLPAAAHAGAAGGAAAYGGADSLVANDTAVVDALARFVRTAVEHQLIAASMVADYAALLRRSNLEIASAGPAFSAAARSALGARLLEVIAPAAPVTLQQPRSNLHFVAADEIYVGNAGLVVLWPFLERFFERLGLVAEKRFLGNAARSRAAGLLQYVAAADKKPPEYLLALNKVLCGLAPDDVFDFGADISAEEMEECDDLVRAVVEQAPILRDMSVEGFRASFLLRQGKLAARDGNWLLCVQRETHDIVLDQFAWGIQFVSLPWMPTMMQVEW